MVSIAPIFIRQRLILTLHSALPPPEVTTTFDSTLSAGDQLVLECNVSMVSFLTVAPTVQWVAPNNIEIASDSGPSLTHTLDPVRTSDTGQYTCWATVDIPSVGVSVSGQSSTTVTVQSKSSEQGECSSVSNFPCNLIVSCYSTR